MINYPAIDPVALSLGPIKLHWYGIMYLVGFASAYFLGKKRISRFDSNWTKDTISDMIFYVAMGVIIGGRIGYVFFYDLASIIDNPLKIFAIWNGGMSFHGGLIGVAIFSYWFACKQGKTFLEFMDFIAPLVPIGLGAGRIGNFINSELWGKATDVPWAMIFPNGGNVARHPSQLYQFFLEGVVLFCIVWIFSNKRRPTASVCGVFTLCYSLFRFIVEFWRMPDAHLGYIAFGWLTMGQILSLPMIVLGAGLIIYAYKVSLPKNKFSY